MSEIIVIDRDELNHIIENTARIAGAEGARLALSQQTVSKSDKIDEHEAMLLLDCKKRKLATLRDDRQIEFYTNTKPFRYSRQSILDYIDSTKIKRVKVS